MATREGKWLQPTYDSMAVFEKDFPVLELPGLDVICPGCKKPVKLARKSPQGRIAGWCRRCNRGVMP